MTTFEKFWVFLSPIKVLVKAVFFCFFAISAIVATHSVAQEGSATLLIEVHSDTSANRGKNYKITHYADENCAKRGKSDKVFEKKYAKQKHVFERLPLETGSNFVFQIAYNEKRREGTRACTVMADFAPEAGHTYKALYTVIEEVIGCELKIYDISGSGDAGLGSAESASTLIEVAYSKPEFACKKVGKKGFKNGTPVYSYKNRLD